MIDTIQSDIMHFLSEYLLQAIAFATILGGFLLLCNFIYLHRKKQALKMLQRSWYYKVVLWYLLLVYVYMVLAITLFSRTPSVVGYYNLQMFSTFGTSAWHQKCVYENILLFVPLGMLTYLLFKRVRRVYRVWLLGLCASILIETTQYITHLGLFQVDDMYNNVIGMTIGYGLGEMIVSGCRWIHSHSFL